MGELDLATAEPLERAIRQTNGAAAAPLMLDLQGLSFMDCSGIRVLLKAHADARTTRARLTVACGPGPVRRLLNLTGADQTLEIIDRPGILHLTNGVGA